MKRLNRALTSTDMKSPSFCGVLVQVYADKNCPMYITLGGRHLKDIKDIDNDNTRKVTNWRFEVHSEAEGSIEYKELTDCKHIDDKNTSYDVIIG